MVDARAIRLEAVDEAPGVPASEHDRIFGKFYRLDPGHERRRARHGGTACETLTGY